MTHALIKYLKSGHTDRKSRSLSYFSAYKVAETLFAQFDSESFHCTEDTFPLASVISLEVAGKSAPIHHSVFRYLEANPHPAIHSACIFGSLSDGTACSYSDFDGLLIIDCSRIQSAISLLRLRKIMKRTEELMLETDPLQHHGWHIALTDQGRSIIGLDLPIGLLGECLAVLPSKSMEFHPCPSLPKTDAMHSFRQTTASIRRKLADTRTIDCIYTLKTLCSEMMLIPALLLQALGHPVLKRDSFKLIEKFIKTEQLSALRTVSQWRRNWTKPDLNSKIRIFHLLRKTGLRASFLLPAVPIDIRQTFPDWKKKSESFLKACEQRLDNPHDQG